MKKNETPYPKRTIRSFVRREGRITKGQKEALETLWSSYGLELQKSQVDFKMIFKRDVDLVFEIGFGMGDSLIEMAKQDKETCFIGVEVFRPGVGKILASIHEEALDNIRVYSEDATVVLKTQIADHQLDKVQIFFPDPWPKKRHQKRRLINAELLNLIYQKLKPGGLLHIATDWQHYAYEVMDLISQDLQFKNMSGDYQFTPRPAYRPQTKFESRGLALGHGVWDLLFLTL